MLFFCSIGMINIGYEHAFSQHWTGQADLFYFSMEIFWEDIYKFIWAPGNPLLFLESNGKWYIGANMGMAVYDMQKWNYWNTSLYQKGI